MTEGPGKIIRRTEVSPDASVGADVLANGTPLGNRIVRTPSRSARLGERDAGTKGKASVRSCKFGNDRHYAPRSRIGRRRLGWSWRGADSAGDISSEPHCGGARLRTVGR
jgi:hypothetical protein